MRLVRFLLLNFAGGAVLGVAVGVAFLHAIDDLDLLFHEPLAALMVMWSLSASMGMGAIGTGLASFAGE